LKAARFITLEGGEGAGKSTQAPLLARALALEGVPVVCTREPGGAPGAELLRGLLLSGKVDWSAQAETLLHFAARAEHVERTIRPALRAGVWVVCDRFSDSTMVYQGYGQGADRKLVSTLTGLMGLIPDLTLVLDVSAQTAKARRAERRRAERGAVADRYERLDGRFHARVSEGFRDIAAQEPARCVLIRADATPLAVHREIVRAIGERLATQIQPLATGP
jgi:dTMP kinase